MRQQLTDRIPDVFPGLGAKIAQARDYRYLDHRADLDTALFRPSALHDQDRSLLLVWGPCGSGKTVTVLRWAMDQHLDGRDVLWVSSHALVHLFKRVLPDTEASTLWYRLRSARVVVVDDFQGFHCRDWTDNVAAEMGFLLQDFMDRDWTRAVLISNRDPAEILRAGGELGDRTRSRFNEQGRAISCFGKDMRMGRQCF
jgi:chromosomal replication initiation ATPase DnaA